jgi:hypothetical protein
MLKSSKLVVVCKKIPKSYYNLKVFIFQNLDLQNYAIELHIG